MVMIATCLNIDVGDDDQEIGNDDSSLQSNPFKGTSTKNEKRMMIMEGLMLMRRLMLILMLMLMMVLTMKIMMLMLHLTLSSSGCLETSLQFR